MKKCPKCDKSYDDSWTVCLTCRADLIPINGPSMNLKEIEAVQSEMNDIRGNIATLSERLNRLEFRLGQKTAKHESAEPESIKINVFKEEKTDRHKEKEAEPYSYASVFKGEGPSETERDTKVRRKWTENFEQMLGEKWFNKLGILAVVVGVALLIGYSFKYMGPAVKIGIGYAFGASLLLFGTYMEKKENFSIYGKTLIGGGWAINYFTTYAMHHIEAVRLINSPILGMLLLLAVSAATIIHTYKYKSQLATAFSYLLIFITLMIHPVSLYTMASTLLVSLSLIFFMYKLRWNEFAIYGMVMTYLTFMATGKLPENDSQFLLSLSFIVIYWGIFVFANLLMKERIRNENDTGQAGEQMLCMRELTLLINTLLASSMVWNIISNGFMKYLIPILGLGIALYSALTVILYIMRQRSLYIISSSFAILFSIILLTNKFEGYSLTVSYILLAEVVMLLGIVFKEVFWRTLSFAFLAATLAKLLIIDALFTTPEALANGLNTRIALFSFAFVIYIINYFLYSGLKNKNLISKAEEYYPVVMSYMYPAIYAMGTWLDLPKVLTAPSWIILGVILFQFGISKNNRHQRIQGYFLTLGAFVRLLMSNMLVSGGISILSYRMLTAVPVIMLLYYCLMLLRDKDTENILNEGEKKLHVLYTYVIFAGIMFLARYEAKELLVAPVWAVIAAVYSVRGIQTRQPHYLSISSLAALFAGIRAVFVNIIQPQYLVGAEANFFYPVVTIGILYAGNIIYFIYKERTQAVEATGEGRIRVFLRSSRFVFGLVATIVMTSLIMANLHGVGLTIGLGIEGLLLFLVGFGIKERNWRFFGLIILLSTLVKAFLVDLRQLSTIHYILSLIALGLALLFVSYIYTKNKDKIKKLI